VNKTESRVELIWNLRETNCLDDRQKGLLEGRMEHRLTEEGVLILASEKYRSQHRNREDVTLRFLELVKAGLVPVKKRRPTKPTRTSVEHRIKSKKILKTLPSTPSARLKKTPLLKKKVIRSNMSRIGIITYRTTCHREVPQTTILKDLP